VASASWTVCLGALAVVALGGLAACDSTQSKNERAKLSAARELASRKPQRVVRRNPAVDVVRVAAVRGRGRAGAVVVELRSRARTPLTDVPIAVGVRAGGRRLVVNARRGLDWFQTHVPAIPAGGAATWVFSGRVPLGRPFAVVGVPGGAVRSSAASLPAIAASAAPGQRVVVENDSDVPQYGLQVYALASAGGRYLAAGKAALEHLGTGGRQTVRVPLTGSARGGRLRVYAIPTNFE